jgi:hypothetical protein
LAWKPAEVRREINELGDWRGKTLAKVREIILIWARCRRQNLIRVDHLRRATGLSMLGLLDYRDWPHCGLHSPRAERMRENIPVTPSA